MTNDVSGHIFPLLKHLPFLIVDNTKKEIIFLSEPIQKKFSANGKLTEKSLKHFWRLIGLSALEIRQISSGKRNIFISENNYVIFKYPIWEDHEIIILSQLSEKQLFKAELKKRKSLIEIINKIFLSFSRETNIEELLQYVVEALHDSEFPYYHVGIFLVDDSGEFIYLAALAGKNKKFFEKEFPDGYFQSIHEGLIGKSIRLGKVIVAEDVKEEQDYQNLGVLPTVSEICVPIKSNGKVIGAINIEAEIRYSPDEWELTLIENIANYLGLVISNKLLVLELEEKQKEMENYVLEVQEAKERIENQTFEIIETMEEIEEAKQLIEKQNRIIQNELEMAGQLQRSLITPVPEVGNIEIATWYEPSASLGGDFYDFKLMGVNRLLFIEVDVTGHGVSSALLAAMSKISFQNAAESYYTPGDLLSIMNREFVSLNKTDMFFTAFVGMIDFKTRNLHYSNASHPYPILLRGEEVIYLDTDGFMVGVMPDIGFEDKKIKLEQDDVLLVYTDGIIEARNEEDEQFGQERLIQVIRETKNQSLQEVLEHVVKTVKQFSSQNLEDDVTLLAFRIL
jgi:sigma-B regulation protein RsbU (phosphoserine phosphatase)